MDVNWEAVSAVATVAAVMVALGFSLQPILKSSKEKKDITELAAAKMLSPLMFFEHWASSIHAVLVFNMGDYARSNAELRRLLKEISLMSSLVSTSDLHSLLGLENHAAKRCARAMGLIQTFEKRVEAFLAVGPWDGMSDREKAKVYSNWAKEASEFHDYLIIAVRSCEVSASIAAPRPSSLEIHGNE